MSLNIKNEEAHKLAQSVADETGESLTEAVTVALRERLERLRQKRLQDSKAKDLMEIGKRFAKRLKGETIDIDSFLYDEKGLPK